MPEIYRQPSAAPTRKVTAVGFSGAVATLLAFAAAHFGVDVPPGVEAALASVIAFFVGYAVADNKQV